MPSLKSKLLEPWLGLKLWILIGICCGSVVVLILCLLLIWILFRRKSKNRFSISQVPAELKDINVDMVGKNSEKVLVHLGTSKSSEPDNLSQCSSVYHHEKSSEEGGSGTFQKNSLSPYNGGLFTASPLVGLPEMSHLGWGHWFTLRDLEVATSRFSADKVLGEGGYGVVYHGRLINGTEVAVKKLLNNLGQAEKEFRVEVEAIGHVRHKNLVRLLGFCIEGVHRMLVYEYVNNGNLEQWLHGAMSEHGTLSWAARMKVVLCTAKALAYLHEGIEPKVVHRDIKSSNILIDEDFNAKVSDFGLAKLLGSGESHITTRVMGTFGYVAPEYASSGLLNEKSDIYSFGVVLLEAITGRDPVNYGHSDKEVHLIEWLKMMVSSRRVEDIIDPNLEPKPSTRALKRVLLVALRCVDLEADKRPKMTQVVRLLDAEEYPYHEYRDRRNRKNPSMEIDSLKESPGHGYLRSKFEVSDSRKLYTTDAYN